MTNTTNLGTVGKRINLAAQYAKGSYQIDVTFKMGGNTFRAQRFVRTDRQNLGGQIIDSTYLFIVPPADAYEGYDEYVKTIDRALPCKVGARALHLLAVAECDYDSDMELRFAQMELA